MNRIIKSAAGFQTFMGLVLIVVADNYLWVGVGFLVSLIGIGLIYFVLRTEGKV
jgi:membrane glycosyltransferase